jgi:hypothetical protein
MGLAGHLFHIAIGGAKPFVTTAPPRRDVVAAREALRHSCPLRPSGRDTS